MWRKRPQQAAMMTRQEGRGGAQPTRGAQINGDDEAKAISERDEAARRLPGMTQTVGATAMRRAQQGKSRIDEASVMRWERRGGNYVVNAGQ